MRNRRCLFVSVGLDERWHVRVVHKARRVFTLLSRPARLGLRRLDGRLSRALIVRHNAGQVDALLGSLLVDLEVVIGLFGAGCGLRLLVFWSIGPEDGIDLERTRAVAIEKAKTWMKWGQG